MASSSKAAGKNGRGIQSFIVRFRVSPDLHERLTMLAHEEELCLAAFVRKLVLDSLKKFPG